MTGWTGLMVTALAITLALIGGLAALILVVTFL
jgi:hypothetical protein